MNPLLKLAIEAGPLAVFFFVNARYGLFNGTGAFMAASAVALPLGWVLERRVPIMPLVSGFFVFVFGGLTLYLADEIFIKLKPTIVNALFATTLLAGLAFKRSLLKPLFGTAFKLTEDGWRTLTLRWGLFFVFLAILNEIVWRNSTTDFWIAFKLFGAIPISLLFAIAQTPLILRHQVIEEGADGAEQATDIQLKEEPDQV